MAKGFVSGVLASLLALGAVVCGQVAPSNASTPEGVVQSAGTPAGPQFTWTGDLDARRVSLVDGRVSADSSGASNAIPVEIAEGVTKGFLVVKSRTRDDRADTGTIYQISMLGAPTGYWIKAQITGSSATTRAACFVFKGDPEQGGKIAEPSPFTCAVKKTHASHELRFTFELALNRWAEASGKISTYSAQELSLTKGTFRSDLPYRVAGVTEMAPFQYTSFETVNREGDKSYFKDQARTEFSYEIKVHDKPTGFWVAGMSTNYRDPVRFKGDGRCAIYDHDPLLNNGRLDDATPIVSKDYVCKAEGRYIPGDISDGHIHWHTDFNVARIWP